MKIALLIRSGSAVAPGASIPILLAIVVAGCQKTPELPSTFLTTSITQEQRDRLSPEVLTLLTDIEEKKAAGSLASDYTKALEKAGEIHRGKKNTDYMIDLDDRDDLAEHPTIVVRVDNESGRIIRCGTINPEWYNAGCLGRLCDIL